MCNQMSSLFIGCMVAYGDHLSMEFWPFGVKITPMEHLSRPKWRIGGFSCNELDKSGLQVPGKQFQVPGNCYHHDPYIKGVIYGKATGVYRLTTWPLKSLIKASNWKQGKQGGLFSFSLSFTYLNLFSSSNKIDLSCSHSGCLYTSPPYSVCYCCFLFSGYKYNLPMWWSKRNLNHFGSKLLPNSRIANKAS